MQPTENFHVMRELAKKLQKYKFLLSWCGENPISLSNPDSALEARTLTLNTRREKLCLTYNENEISGSCED